MYFLFQKVITAFFFEKLYDVAIKFDLLDDAETSEDLLSKYFIWQPNRQAK
jgi:hypothetical protein